VLDKSGGMPEDNKFVVRSAIERWALDDWMDRGYDETAIKNMDYIEVFLGYWQRYHYTLALVGIPSMPTSEIVVFGKKPMMEYTEKLFERLNVNIEPEEFKESKPRDFSKKYEKMADKVIKNVANFWDSLGLKFPASEL